MKAKKRVASLSVPRLLMRASPFLRMREGAALLGVKSIATVHARLEDGSLRAIDISCRWPSRQRELRIYRYTVFQLLIEGAAECPPPRLEYILPHRRPAFSRDELTTLLRCCPKHIAHLSRAGALRGPEPPEGTAKMVADLIPITFRRSLMNFLKQREVHP
jgi:hypothetical protein